MATSQTSEVIQHLRRMVHLRDGAALTDEQLLADYRSRRDEAALAALVRRHASMVWGVCRRVLSDHHDAEDAFQATFLVLVRRAASITSPELLANWLYGVAHRTALKARATTARRRAREKQVMDMPEPATTERELWADLQPLLDQELSRLPDKYRAAIVFCDLEGMTRKEAARRLGVPDGTLAARLARGRALLAKRLARQGVGVSGGLLAAVVVQNAALATVPAAVLDSTIKAAHLFAAGSAAGTISAKVSALAGGVLRSMLLTKATAATAVLLVVGILGTGSGWLRHQARAGKPPDKAVASTTATAEEREVSGMVKGVDTSRSTLRVRLGKVSPREATLPLTGDAKVFLDDGTGDRLAFREGQLADVSEGIAVTLRLTGDGKVSRIWAEGPTVQGTLKAADTINSTLTAKVALTSGEAAVDKTFAVAEDAKFSFDDGLVPDKTQPLKQPRLGDLPVGKVVKLRLSADRKVVRSVRVEGPSIAGLLQAVDADENTITVTIPTKDGPAVVRTFVVVKTAPVSIDDGQPEGKAKPAEGLRSANLPVGAHVTLRLAPDRRWVVAVAAEGPTVVGIVNGVDGTTGTLTLGHKVRGEKTYSVMKDAAVLLDGKDGIRKLADLPVGSVAELKLLIDQKTVREIRVK
jgi:RNA polymerase sigma factor (sigma-70 family)